MKTVVLRKCIACRTTQEHGTAKIQRDGAHLCDKCGMPTVIVKVAGSKKRAQGIDQRLQNVFGAKCEEIHRGDNCGTVRDATNGKKYDWFLTPSGVLIYGEAT